MQLQKLGAVRKETDTDLVGLLFTGMLNQAVLYRILPVQKPDIGKLADKLMDFIKKGVIQEDWPSWI